MWVSSPPCAVRPDLRLAVDEDLEADPAAKREQGEIAMLADEAMTGGGDIVEHADRHAGQACLEQAVERQRAQCLTFLAPECRQGDDAACGVDRARKGGGHCVDGVVSACIVDSPTMKSRTASSRWPALDGRA